MKLPVYVIDMKDDCLLGNDFLSAMGFGETFVSFFGIPSQEKEEESFCSRIMSEGSGVPKFLRELFVKETQDLNEGQKEQFASFLIRFSGCIFRGDYSWKL